MSQQQPCIFCRDPNCDPNSQASLECCYTVACRKCLKNFVDRKKSEGYTEIHCPNTACWRKKTVAFFEAFCSSAPTSIPLHNFCPFCWAEYPEENPMQTKVKCKKCHEISCKLCHGSNHSGLCLPREKIIKEYESEGCKVVPCPYCLRLSMVEGLTSSMKKCPYCTRLFCAFCAAKGDPIKAHGNHYHRKGCIWYGGYNDKVGELNENCEECKTMEECCKQPKDLIKGDIPPEEITKELIY